MISKPKEKRVSASELDDRLSAENGEALRKELIGKLENYFGKVKGEMNKGSLTPKEYDAAEYMIDAIIQATGILTFYKKL